MPQLIECVANYSEGNNSAVIASIVASINKVFGTQVLHVDSGKAANRTVVTFAGSPDAVVEAAFQSIKIAAECIDMSKHTGIHPRIGATDVCPLVPVSDISLDEVNVFAKNLAKRVGEELCIPVYCYEHSASAEERRSLATIRKGEYEGLACKMKDPMWLPDFGPSAYNARVCATGATVIGARNFLIAYNVNLQQATMEKANYIASRVRESGYKDADGKRRAGRLTKVRAIAWYVKEYGLFQVSTNILDYHLRPIHTVYETIKELAAQEHVAVVGSELIGLIPRDALIVAGKHYADRVMTDREAIDLARSFLQLNRGEEDFVHKRILEYLL